LQQPVTVEKLKDIKPKVMAQMLNDQDATLMDLTFEERIGIMVEKEWISRKNSRNKRLLYSASLGIDACIEDIDYTADRKIDKKTVQTLSACAFIAQKLNIVLIPLHCFFQPTVFHAISASVGEPLFQVYQPYISVQYLILEITQMLY
jgi:hypothetical protein